MQSIMDSGSVAPCFASVDYPESICNGNISYLDTQSVISSDLGYRPIHNGMHIGYQQIVDTA